MRLKADIWVMAYVRRVNSAGGSAMVIKRGDADAGAIYIKVLPQGTPFGQERTAALYGPAPAGLDDVALDRRWVCLHPGDQPESVADTTLDRQRKFDADIWIVEVEDRGSRHFLEGWLV